MTIHDIVIILVHLALAAVGVWLIVLDAREHRLPNRIVLPVLASLVVLLIADALVLGETARLWRSLLGMLVLTSFYLVLRWASRRGIGGGDVKLAAVVGLLLAWHGWTPLVVGAAAAFVLASLYALGLMAVRRANRQTRIAFGPWMIIGTALGIVMV